MSVRRSRKIHNSDDARRLARQRLPKMMFDFIEGGSGDESLTKANNEAIAAVKLMPRVLLDVGERDMTSTIMGLKTGLPFGIAPMGMCNLAWPRADLALAHEAKGRNMPHCLSTASSTPLERVIEASEGQTWFQLYASQEAFTLDLVKRAAAAQYKVLILTVDVPILSNRVRDGRNGLQFPFKMGLSQFIDFATHPHWSLATLAAGAPRTMNYETASVPIDFARSASRGLANWDFLRRLRDIWKGKLVVKGVCNGDDAAKIAAIGVDAIYVSNHGGRQLNAGPPAITALAQIRARLGDDFSLIFDSGIQHGEDIIKALAVGADFVMVGRPMMLALGAAGAPGLSRMLDILTHDASTTLGLTGLTDVKKVSRALLA
ncbi:alpha-hydroxy-acid oxidizing protein [Alphaproteobacteria bacterium]|nr:alpha-hydroxy-acid oxidizing protein [Alphaproteobacteria bacterium]